MNAMTQIRPSAEIPEDEDLLTVQDVAARVKVTVTTVYRWISAGRFPGGRMIGGSRRWTRREEQKKCRWRGRQWTQGDRVCCSWPKHGPSDAEQYNCQQLHENHARPCLP